MSPLHPTTAHPSAHQNDNSIDVKCVAFGPPERLTPACRARSFMALLCPSLPFFFLVPPLLGWADNNLENSLYIYQRTRWGGQRLGVISGSISQGTAPDRKQKQKQKKLLKWMSQQGDSSSPASGHFTGLFPMIRD